MLTALSLLWSLAQHFLALGKSGVQLAIEIISVSQNHQGGICHAGVLDDLASVKHHSEALAAALGVPDDADPPIAFWRSCTERVLHSFIDGMELVISGDLLFYRASRVLEDHKIAD